ncbi:unnamed protein product [Heterobilharzia americana]|nr:unnamed protein product [Heterobilharzia americana]
MDRFQKYVDDHLKVIRLLPTTFFAFGVYLLAKHFYIFTKFNSIHAIPSDVYSRQIRLKGLINSVDHTGELEIFHVPKIRIPINTSPGNSLRVCIPVQHSERSRQWMKQNFQPGDVTVFIPVKLLQDDRLLAIVFKKWYFFRKDISYHLLVNGMVDAEKLDDLPEDFRTKYIGAISKAKKKKKGIWRENSRFRKTCKSFLQRMKSLLNL